MVVFQCSSVSSDAVLISLSFLLIAMFFRYAYGPEDELSKHELGLLVFLCLMISLSKQTM